MFCPPYDPETSAFRRECVDKTCNPDWQSSSWSQPEAIFALKVTQWPPENFRRIITICGRCNYNYLLPDSAAAAFHDGWLEEDHDLFIRGFPDILLAARERVARGEGKPGGPGLLSNEEYEALKASVPHE